MNDYNSGAWKNTNGVMTMVFGGVDLQGNPVSRTRQEFPYSYDSYVVWRTKSKLESTSSAYTDRLRTWYPNADEVWKKHAPGGRGNYHDLSGASPTVIQSFLRELLECPNLELIAMMDGCNASSGYPVGYLTWNDGKDVDSGKD